MYDHLNSLPVEDVARRLGIEVRRHTCRCFMHDDHHPSMFFSVARNRWRCFVCDVGGGPIDLVMHHRHLNFTEACQWLSDSYGIDVPTPSSHPSSVKPPTSKGGQIPNSGTLPNLQSSMFNVQSSMFNIQSSMFNLQSSIFNLQSSFPHSMVQTGLLSPEQMRHAADRYRLGSLDDAVIFWQIDEHGMVRDGKAMYYMADGHRSHERKPVSMSWMMKHKLKDADGKPLLDKDFVASRCLFGLHLLSEPTATVAVVESEKTAVVFSELLPDCLWMASGGLSSLTADMLSPLRGRKVILFPDTDPDGITYRRWSAIASEATRSMHQPIMVSPLLEQNATSEQKQRKIDILDYLFQ